MSISTPEPDLSRPGAGAGPAPLWAVIAFTWANSFASGSTFNGIFFITRSAYGFESLHNLWLGLLMGAAYVVGAVAAGPTLRRISHHQQASPRNTLVALMLAGAGLCLLPVGAWYLTRPEERAATQWAVWVFVGLYSALSGALWPIVESFLSGGRSGRVLRSATGRFNVAWSSALVVALWAMAPFIEHNAMVTPALCAGVHVCSIGFLVFLPARPATHGHDAHPVPANYPDLLRVHRILLPMAYMVMYALNPILPTVLESLKIAPALAVLFTSSWQITRVATFFLLDRWHGWHGRWLTATAAPLLLLAGFAATVLSPAAGGVPAALAGLISFGLGAAAIYTAALYYALEVGAAEVEAGGMHEAMIGVGYTLGPACGLVPMLLAPAAPNPPPPAPASPGQTIHQPAAPPSNGPMLAVVAGLSGAALAGAWWARSSRSTPAAQPSPTPPDIPARTPGKSPAVQPPAAAARSS